MGPVTVSRAKATGSAFRWGSPKTFITLFSGPAMATCGTFPACRLRSHVSRPGHGTCPYARIVKVVLYL